MTARLRHDEDAAFPVLEAVLVAVLILTTILFFTSLQRPTTATDEGGIDLGRLASDTLEILETKEFTRAGCPQLATAKGLEQWVGAALNGTECVADEVEEFLAEVLPPGTRFLVRLDNGVEPLVLVPYGSTETPRAARAASTFVTPAWMTNMGHTSAEAVHPGRQILDATANPVATAFATPASIACIKGPSGSATAPGGATWLSLWQPTAPETPPRVPSSIPYGGWVGYTNADCNAGATYLFVGLADGTATDYPVHGLQLVVWFGA